MRTREHKQAVCTVTVEIFNSSQTLLTTMHKGRVKVKPLLVFNHTAEYPQIRSVDQCASCTLVDWWCPIFPIMPVISPMKFLHFADRYTTSVMIVVIYCKCFS